MILKLCCSIIEVSQVVVVRITLTNDHIKFLKQTSIGLAPLMDTLPTIIFMD